MCCTPASSVIATNGTPRQMLAKITDQRAFHGSPRKSILVVITPIWRSDHEMIENWLSYSHQNEIAESTVGTMNGISTIERMIALNGKLWLSSTARYRPTANLMMLATTWWRRGLNAESQKTLSPHSHS